MRLLKIPHDLEDLTLVPQLEDFTGKVPPYAILSHTWGSQGSEVTYSDVVNGTHRSKSGWQKTVKAVKIAQKHRLHYLWCDTYCIDKSSSAELSEAINSMYEWYGKAICCYAYLDDVNCVEGSADWDGIIKRSRWFTRGWTLQELLAPVCTTFEDTCSHGLMCILYRDALSSLTRSGFLSASRPQST